MKLLMMLIIVLMMHCLSAQRPAVKLLPKSMLSLPARPSTSVFAANPHAWIVSSLSVSIVLGYLIFYYFIGPISPVLTGSKPSQPAFGLVRR